MRKQTKKSVSTIASRKGRTKFGHLIRNMYSSLTSKTKTTIKIILPLLLRQTSKNFLINMESGISTH